jgi:hypothetical protein
MLYHFSEDPTITIFVPRPPLAHPNAEPLVWTIDHIHAPLYFFPRECPRAAFWPLPTTTPEDRARLYTGTSARMVIAIEYDWLERLRNTRLYRYEMPPETFVPHTNDPRAHYGGYISQATLVPFRVEPLSDLLHHLQEENVELRLCHRLAPLVRALLSSTLHYSCLRLRNAQDWPKIQNL